MGDAEGVIARFEYDEETSPVITFYAQLDERQVKEIVASLYGVFAMRHFYVANGEQSYQNLQELFLEPGLWGIIASVTTRHGFDPEQVERLVVRAIDKNLYPPMRWPELRHRIEAIEPKLARGEDWPIVVASLTDRYDRTPDWMLCFLHFLLTECQFMFCDPPGLDHDDDSANLPQICAAFAKYLKQTGTSRPRKYVVETHFDQNCLSCRTAMPEDKADVMIGRPKPTDD